MAPLWDFSRGQFVGVLSALDFILILREVSTCKKSSLLSTVSLLNTNIYLSIDFSAQIYMHRRWIKIKDATAQGSFSLKEK
jgi:hypothetical protein